MKQYKNRLPNTPQKQDTKQLLQERIEFFENKASVMLSAENISALTSDPRSPVACKSFFNEKSRVIDAEIPLVIATPMFASSTLVDEKSSQANIKLGHALDLDERGANGAAISAYMEAAELYLHALKATEQMKKGKSNAIDNTNLVLRRHLELTIDRVEKLKKTGLKHRIDKCRPGKQKKEVPLSNEEISVLKRSSLIASRVFMPWSDKDAHKLSLSTSYLPTYPLLWEDPDGLLPLSDKQKHHFHRWARPSEIVSLRQQLLWQQKRNNNKTIKSPVMVLQSISPYNIQQKAVTDCSFIASLCICAAYERKFKKRLITSIVYPQDKNGSMLYSLEGKYMVKLWLNGVARQVFVDDKLPIDRYGNLLCAHTKVLDTELELWVSIIEKAYMKLCGGYNFPGSNSGVDLFALTGWIPERIVFAKDSSKIQDFETHPERAWERLFSASSYGDCLITMSSQTKLSNEQASALGLYSGHAYALLSVIKTFNGTRLLQLKNPWGNKGWNGKFSSGDLESWSDQNFCAEVGYNPKEAAKYDDGVFWICWNDLLKYFQNIHMSWNPALFQHSFTTHGFWPRSQGPIDDTFNCGENPQYLVHMSEQALKKGATLWILISRHVTKQEQGGSEPTEFLTLHLHKNTEGYDKIWYNAGRKCVLNGAYTNNPHNLVRYDVKNKDDAHLSIVLSQFEKKNDIGYTLSCFCTELFTFGRPSKQLSFIKEFPSSWNASTAGGPIGQPGFYKNPMYAVEVQNGGVTIQLRCSASKTIAVNTMLIPVDKYGARVNRLKAEPPVDSGNYRHGFVVTEKIKIPAGYYTIIVSSYNDGQIGPFCLKVCSSVALRIAPI